MGPACVACETARGTAEHGWDLSRASFNPEFDARAVFIDGSDANANDDGRAVSGECARDACAMWLETARGLDANAIETMLSQCETTESGMVRVVDVLRRSGALDEGNFPFAPTETDESEMTSEMSAYFVNSSHNTYLDGDQLFSRASVAAIAGALDRGCRVIELDVYDGKKRGDKPRPIVTHGGTAVRPMYFEDAIKVIAERAHVASEYPVIVTLENHASKETRAEMSRILRSTLGDKLWAPKSAVAGIQLKRWPSPLELKGRVIVRDKIKHKQDELQRRRDQRRGLCGLCGTKKQSKQRKVLPKSLNVRKNDKVCAMQSIIEFPRSSTGVFDEGAVSSSSSDSEGEQDDEDLKRIVSVPNVKFRSFHEARDVPRFSCSWSERKLKLKIEKESSKDIIEFTNTHLLRTYPAGHRIFSNNYDPSEAWDVGASFVALNFQALDRYVWANRAKFRVNGNCGYVKKPAYLLDPTIERPSKPRRLQVKVFAGIGWDNFKDADRFSPPDSLIRITTLGCLADRTKPGKSNRTSVYSKARAGPEAQPVWNDTFELAIFEPELALMQIQALDKDGNGDELLAHYDFPISKLREGVRIVPMLNRDDEFIHDKISCAGVLMSFKWLD